MEAPATAVRLALLALAVAALARCGDPYTHVQVVNHDDRAYVVFVLDRDEPVGNLFVPERGQGLIVDVPYEVRVLIEVRDAESCSRIAVEWTETDAVRIDIEGGRVEKTESVNLASMPGNILEQTSLCGL
jgi:hypothetical protein